MKKSYNISDLLGKTFELDVGSSSLSSRTVVGINRDEHKIKSVNAYGKESITDAEGFAFMAGIIINKED